jgi:hypothetical protein
VVEAKLEFYAQFEKSDCLMDPGSQQPHMLKELASHHYILTVGRNTPDLEGVVQIFVIGCQVLA